MVNYGIANNFEGLVEYIEKTPTSELLLQVLISIIVALAIAGVIILCDKTKRNSDGKKATSFRDYMIEDGAIIMEPSDESDKFNSIRGSMVAFLRRYDEERTDAELAELVKKYCVYVDKEYGSDVVNVENNIGKDYKELLDGSLV